MRARGRCFLLPRMDSDTRRPRALARRLVTVTAATLCAGAALAGANPSAASTTSSAFPASPTAPRTASAPSASSASTARPPASVRPTRTAAHARAAHPRAAHGRLRGVRGAYTRPVAIRAPVSQRWGIRGHWAAGHHTGVDLSVPIGTPVRSVGSGQVVFAGRSGDYGNAVTIRMTDGRYTLFAHLSRVGVRVGQRVSAGTLIGRSGNTGRTTGPHLHFEVRAKRGYGTDVDPVAYLAQRGVHIP